ncbi:hypothetical protein PMAYCL1PPCAC_32255, partial [Pristionchus mayeri]
MIIPEPTEEQKKEYLARIPKVEIFEGQILPGVIHSSQKTLSLKDFPLDENDVIIASFPKSGTIWTCELVSAIVHDADLETIKGITIEERALRMELLDSIVPEREASYKLGKTRPTGNRRVWRTHLLPEQLPLAAQQGKCKVIYVARNPKDTAVSYFHFHRMAKFFGPMPDLSWDNFFLYFTTGFICGGSWFKHVTSYWKFC